MEKPLEEEAVPGLWGSYAALGDSFTEGLDDPWPDGSFRGWADRLAGHLATARPHLRYANLAIRGKLLGQIIDEQLPVAVALQPELVTFCAGGNDILRPGSDPDALAVQFEAATAQLRKAGADVVICTGFDTKDVPIMRRVRGKVATYNAHLRAIADRHNCYVVDLWSMTVLHDPRAWSEDRLHLSPEGHERVALRACAELGIPVTADWSEPWPVADPADWLTLRRADLKWARQHFVPWLGRRLAGRSSADGIEPKRPELAELCEKA
ncbi:SGNH/GDSL hydrolase family protein [Crossiella sp. CA-258035]|uniref:SGNH/GDSL hydrolase family protein n=1 Tax=Crossiella sp. CA-258035 TaxID=2981138 RepID=UPI0024BC2FC1|nr:SGNH/GDSL hydrolase family protein [Crossiella sp. CA-258035]WHT19905.1 SGNH/GDSL hydrolase family protein [Crossiella sp. CA-258035]